MRTLINDGWFFAKLKEGSSPADAREAVFQPVDLPHDWLIWQEGDLYETADAWYRRTIELPEGHDPVVQLYFDGVYMDCDVLLNGEVLYTHPYGYTAFYVPLTGKLLPGRNELAVHIRHRSPNSRWYSGSGIYRDVTLLTLPEEHIIPDSIYIHETEENGTWKLNVSCRICGGGEKPLSCTLTDREGNIAAQGTLPAGSSAAEVALVIPEGKTWSPEDPYLYQLELKYGKQTEVRKIGLRTVGIHPDRGFLLNGQAVKLKGVCLHHDLGALGAAFHEKAAGRQLELMKAMGANAVRTSHNPPASAFLDLCDSMGILVVDEAFDMWERSKTEFDYARFFPEWYKEDVASWIRRDRCHPCVIMWSVGNEIYDMHADIRGTEVTAALAEQVRIHDPLGHAFVTFGCNYMPWEGGQRCAGYVDAVGYNYGEKLYASHHREHPEWVIYGSETASVLSSRGIYHFPMDQSIMSEADRQCSALGNSNTSWGADKLSRIIIDDLNCPYSMGQFIWSGIDYIGEPTPYHTRSCYFGQADTACYPKDSYYLFRSYWSSCGMIHIGVTWDWNEGQMIDVPVITNCHEAELILNGETIGRIRPDRNNPDQCVPVWHLPFRPGKLIARGYDEQGRRLCEDCRITPGETEHLVLSCEEQSILSDGWDLAFVTVSAEDKEGNPVENARDRVQVTVTGGGRLIGTDNGDSTDTDGYKSDCRRLFSGRLLLIIASNGLKQDVDIRVSGINCGEAHMTIPVTVTEKRPGTSSIQQVFHRPLSEIVTPRRIDLKALDRTLLTPDHPRCSYRFKVLPETASDYEIRWEVTNAAGIETPYVHLEKAEDTVTVRATGDGAFYLRALCMEKGECSFISQTEFASSGMGNPALDPYSYVSAGLYDTHEGEIGAGNEKGIAFARDGRSMVGFSCVDFGKTGSDVLTADIFALNGDPYEMELWTCSGGQEKKKIAVLRYEKPSIWNVYQPETWKLPVRLTGIQSLFFAMNDKVHMKGFVFEKQQRAWLCLPACSADQIYGDRYERTGEFVTGIGNNVTLTWTDMDFGGSGDVFLEIEGSTPLPVNTVNIRICNEKGDENVSAAEFNGQGEAVQRFRVPVPEGNCTVSLVFLPGSDFNLRSIRFSRPESWTDMKE